MQHAPRTLVLTNDKSSILTIGSASSSVPLVNSSATSRDVGSSQSKGSLRNSRTDAKGVPSNRVGVLKSSIPNKVLGVRPRGAPSICPSSQSVIPCSFGEIVRTDISSPHGSLSGVVSPFNLSQRLNDEWTSYWDSAAATFYYYNHRTGEATWIRPTDDF